MKKFLKIILLLIILISIGAIAWMFKDSYDILGPGPGPIINPNPTESGDNGTASKVVIQDVPIIIKTANKHIECVYPAITSLEDKEFENSINTEIARNVQAYRNEIEFIVDDETPVTALYKYETKYHKYTCGKYLSLVIEQDYQTGGIRSNKWKDIYNINAETERLFYLSEIFKAGIDYKTAIIDEINEQATTKNIELMGGNGLTKIPDKQKFYIKDNKLFIYFAPSEAAATKFGELVFEMPFTMNEEGYFDI